MKIAYGTMGVFIEMEDYVDTGVSVGCLPATVDNPLPRWRVHFDGPQPDLSFSMPYPQISVDLTRATLERLQARIASALEQRS